MTDRETDREWEARQAAERVRERHGLGAACSLRQMSE
jgi:hypothetical protein